MAKENYVSIDTLRSSVKSLPPENRAQFLSVLSKMGIDLSRCKSDLTGTGVAGFIYGNAFHEAESHKDVFLKVVEVILNSHSNEEEKIFEIKGTKKKYFSRSPGDFSHGYEKISGTSIYADTNENAAQLNRRCQRVLQKFGIDPSTLIIIPRSKW